MKHCIVLIVFSALSLAQGTTAIHINVGGLATGAYVADTVCGGTTYSVAGQTGIYLTEKYGKTFSCDVPAPNGTCTVQLDIIENRAAGPNLATDSGVGTRVFTANVNGTGTGPIDIFSVAGALTPYSPSVLIVPVTDGHVRIAFTASVGNAVLSGLDIACVLPPPSPLGVQCSSLIPQTGVVLVVALKDGSCLPISMVASQSLTPGNVQAVWLNTNTAGELTLQSIFTTIPAVPPAISVTQ